jgi:2-methylcitrate dehydratase PrpD
MNAPMKAAEIGVESGSISARLAAFASDIQLSDVPAKVVERAKLHILDCLGIGLASTGFDFGQRTINAVSGLAGQGDFPVIGTPIRLPIRDAVLVNGTLIHGLDFDDTHSGGVIHASASAVPTVMGLGQREGSSGGDLLIAYLIGIETGSRIATAANGGFHRVGFHPTGLVGAFGATLAAGRLAGLTASQMEHAQGVTLSMAAGSLEFLQDGAWTKRMHPGFAAANAILACTLARNGFIGPKKTYEGRYGLFASHLAPGQQPDLSLCTKDLGNAWEMLNVAIKPYAACHFNHAFADAALAIRKQHRFELSDIESIKALIGDGPDKVVCEPEANKRRPQNSYDAQFSTHYTIATALVRGRYTLAELEDDALNDPRSAALMQKTTYAIDPQSAYPRYYSGEVIVKLKDGRELRHREAQNRGSDARPLTADEIIEKYRGNALRVVSASRAQRLADAVLSLDRAPNLDALLAAVRAS